MGELILDLDHCPAQIVAARWANNMRRNGSLAFGAVVKLRWLNGVVAASPTRTALGLSALGSGHGLVNSNCSRLMLAMAKPHRYTRQNGLSTPEGPVWYGKRKRSVKEATVNAFSVLVTLECGDVYGEWLSRPVSGAFRCAEVFSDKGRITAIPE
jgi:hypothetical protein